MCPRGRGNSSLHSSPTFSTLNTKLDSLPATANPGMPSRSRIPCGKRLMDSLRSPTDTKHFDDLGHDLKLSIVRAGQDDRLEVGVDRVQADS